MDMQDTHAQAIVTERVRLESVRRNLVVKSVERLSSGMMRVVLGGSELQGFHSPSPDDHIKLFFPTPDGAVAARDYTPRKYDPVAGTLAVDFVLHEGGAGAAWAQQARAGDVLQIGGPRGSTILHTTGAWWLLIGDEAALPSIARRVEALPAGTQVTTLIAVTGAEEQQEFETKAALTAVWAYRPSTQAADAAPVLQALAGLTLPDGPGIIWIGAESAVARAVRNYVVDTLGHPVEWIKAAAYWSIGGGDVDKKL